ncbi:MAG: F0F1 ATP synthase subunit epsilon, partial [Shimia sp.]
MQFDLVSPERRLASLEVTEVQIPGADGDMTAMADHAPTITTLRPGVLKAIGGGEDQQFFVTGGFAEIGEGGVTVLAERAMPTGEVTQDVFDGLVGDAVKARDEAPDDLVDSAAKLLADMVAAGGEIGLDPK